VWTWVDPLGLQYGPYQIHSPGSIDVVQKGLHFYGTDGIELSVRPTHEGGITFKNAIPNDANNPKLDRAIRDAHRRFQNNEAFRKDILHKAREGKKSVIEFSKDLEKTLKDLANGRSREMKEIERNVENYQNNIERGVNSNE
jgi:hypothetical protein